jgi:ZIP family zinc transporter
MSMSTNILVMVIACCAFAATMVGGLFAIKLRDRLHLVLGFSAGAVLGVAFFDLMPEALATGSASWGSRNLMLLCAAGFFLYTMLDRAVMLHTGGEGEHCHHHKRGWMGAGSFSAHSFLDGFAIGIGFQASQAIGAVVAIAVLVHDFSDGLNTVNVVVRNGGDRKTALRWLLMDAIAPILGAGVSLFIAFPEHDVALILAMFSGFFLYIGATDLLPESHHAHPKFFTTLATLAGAATLLFATQVAG